MLHVAICENEIKFQIRLRSAQAKYNKQLIDNLQTDPIALFEIMRNKSSLESMIGQLVKADGSFTECDGKAAEVLDFHRPGHISFNQCSQVSVVVLLKFFLIVLANQLFDITFTKSEVFVSLTSLKSNKASGPDSLHSKIPKYCAESFVEPLFLLFTQSINTSTLLSGKR